VNPLLFVYGSLRAAAGHPMHGRLARGAERVGGGTIAATLITWEYPGVVEPRRAGARVRGEVYRLRDPVAVFRELDRYELCAPDSPRPHPYARRETPVALEGGGEVTAWVYWYVGDPAGSREIASGDYLER
jgi:gamma-glutamylcyclotransferase (GGCT)/AIG2-like uncharacterized protein YtfP